MSELADITRNSSGYVHLSWVTEVWQVDWNKWHAEAKWPQDGAPPAVVHVEGPTYQATVDQLQAMVTMVIIRVTGIA